MDAQQFRLKTAPNYYRTSEKNVNPSRVEQQLTQPSQSLNSRYPGSAPIAQDANVFTDYSPRCAKNIPVGEQYATRQWLQHNAEDIIKISRERQAKATGASYMNAATTPPPVAIIKCDKAKCDYFPGSSMASWINKNNIPTGIDRADQAPPLFGTFEFNMRYPPSEPNKTITHRFEGGRNTPRGSLGPTKV